MKQALIFRINNNDILTTEEDCSALFYYIDILKEEDIIFYLYNNDLNFFLDKYLLIKNNEYHLKSISLKFAYFIEVKKEEANNYFFTEINSPLQTHELFFEKYGFNAEDRIRKLIFSYEEISTINNLDVIMVKNDMDLLHKIFDINKETLHYFIYENNKFYIKSLLYKNDSEKEVESVHISDISQFVYRNFN